MHQVSVLPDGLFFDVGYNCVSPAARPQHQGDIYGELSSSSSLPDSSASQLIASLDLARKGEYRCGYCQQTKLSTSGHACGRAVRIRCECGGLQQDGNQRLHNKWTLVTLADTGQFRKVRKHGAVLPQKLALAVGPTDAMFSIDSAAIVGTAWTVSNDFPKARAAGHAIGDSSYPVKKARTEQAPYTAGQNRPEAGLASSEAYDKSRHDEMESYFGKPLDQFIADIEAENSSAAGFSTGNSVDSTLSWTWTYWPASGEADSRAFENERKPKFLKPENDCASGFGTGNASGRSRVLIGIDDSDEKSVLDAQVQKVAMGLVSPLWQHVILVVLSMILVSSMVQDLMRASSSQWIACWIQCADYILLVHNRGIMIE